MAQPADRRSRRTARTTSSSSSMTQTLSSATLMAFTSDGRRVRSRAALSQEARSGPEFRLVPARRIWGLVLCRPARRSGPLPDYRRWCLMPIFSVIRARSTSESACIFRHDPAPMDLDGLLRRRPALAGDFACPACAGHRGAFVAPGARGASGSRCAGGSPRARRGRPRRLATLVEARWMESSMAPVLGGLLRKSTAPVFHGARTLDRARPRAR